MKTHTPGPWHLNTLETVLYSVHANRGCVAEISRGTMNEVPANEIEANARLIAAAPELLAALEALIDAASWTPTDNWRIGPMDSSKGGKMEMARKAIAKAKGQNHE
jgi:hypothetical protein